VAGSGNWGKTMHGSIVTDMERKITSDVPLNVEEGEEENE
jgi:hypothetical protein